MDNASWHKSAQLHWHHFEPAYLPPYSPDLNPIEQTFAKFKHAMRKAAERSIDAIINRVRQIIDDYTPSECCAYLKNSGYGAT